MIWKVGGAACKQVVGTEHRNTAQVASSPHTPSSQQEYGTYLPPTPLLTSRGTKVPFRSLRYFLASISSSLEVAACAEVCPGFPLCCRPFTQARWDPYLLTGKWASPSSPGTALSSRTGAAMTNLLHSVLSALEKWLVH